MLKHRVGEAIVVGLISSLLLVSLWLTLAVAFAAF